MKQQKVIIERIGGSFSAYLAEHSLSYGVTGTGKTVKETISDIEDAYLEMKKLYNTKGLVFEEVIFDYKYTIAAFLQYYSDIFSLVGLSRITGINKGQLSHYINGYRRPSDVTAQKIKKSIKDFAQEINEIQFV